MIYLDDSFQTLCKKQWPSIDNILSRPHKVELVAYRSYYSNPESILRDIEFLQNKTNRIAIAITEPTDRFVDLDRIVHEKFDNVIMFANVMPNYPSKTISNITWFNGTNNPYATSPWARDLLAKLKNETNRPKKFDCLLGRQRLNRDLIFNLYQQCQYQNDFVFTYYKNNIQNGIWDCDVSNISMSADHVIWGHATPCASHIIPTDIYNQSYYSIVAETVTDNEFNFFTEKIAKPLLSKRPFIVFAGQNYLSNLRKIGFETFSDIIDESYDHEPDPQIRAYRAWQQVLLLGRENPDQIMQICQSRLKHNQSHFLNTDWNLGIKTFLDQYS